METRTRKKIFSLRYNILVTWSNHLTWESNKIWVRLTRRGILWWKGRMSIKMRGCRVLKSRMIWWWLIKLRRESRRKEQDGKECMMMIIIKMMVGMLLNKLMKMRTKMINSKMINKSKTKIKINKKNNKQTLWVLNHMKSNNLSVSYCQWTNPPTLISSN